MSCRRRARSIAVLSAAALLMTGCTFASMPTATPTQSQSQSQTSVAATAAPIAAGTEVASAIFTARPGAQASGSLTIVAGDKQGTFEIVAHNLMGPTGSELTVLPYEIGATQTCADTGFRFSLGPLDDAGSTPGPLLPDLTQGDPSFFTSAVFTVYSETDRQQNDCLATVVATAPIVWTMPPQRPGLVVEDAGPRPGAMGSVVVDDAKEATSYTVSKGDALSIIAERFGISLDDIFYLNPARSSGSRNPQAITDEVLNLSVALR